jgi:hypothetical protein
VTELCAREKCGVRVAIVTILLAFLAANLVQAATDWLPRGIQAVFSNAPPGTGFAAGDWRAEAPQRR